MPSPLNPKPVIDGIDGTTLALMHEAVERGDGVYSIDPLAHTMERVVKFPPPRLRRRPDVRTPALVRPSARTPRRRSVRRRPSKARAPDDPSPSPELEAVPLSRFRADVRRWRKGTA